jgi:hypothetical protein
MATSSGAASYTTSWDTTQSHTLQLLRRKPGGSARKWTVKADPFDLSSISVLDEDRQKWIDVPSTDPDLTEGLDIREYRRILEEARIQVEAGQRIYVSNLLAARRTLMAIGHAKGVKAASGPFEIDIDWFRERVDTPVVRVDDIGKGRRPVNPLDRRRQETRERHQKKQGQDPSLFRQAETLPRVEAPPLQPEISEMQKPERSGRLPEIDYYNPDEWT